MLHIAGSTPTSSGSATPSHSGPDTPEANAVRNVVCVVSTLLQSNGS